MSGLHYCTVGSCYMNGNFSQVYSKKMAAEGITV